MSVCMSSAPGEPWQLPTPSLTLTKQHIQTSSCKMVEKDNVATMGGNTLNVLKD